MKNVLVLIMLNVSFWVCNLYPKHIVEINGSFSVLAIVINLIFYLLFSLFLFFSIDKEKDLFSVDSFSPHEKFSKKIELKRILLICATQILFDIIVLSMTFILHENIVYLRDFVTVLMWVVIYIICATKEKNIFRNSKGYIVALVLVLLLLISSHYDFKLSKEYSLLVDKYSVEWVNFEQSINNLDFLFGIKNFLLDTITGSVLLISHVIFNKSDKKKAIQNIQNKKQRIKQKTQDQKIKEAVRFFLVIVIIFVMVFVKTLVFPVSCIKGINIRTSKTHNISESEEFTANTKKTVIKRIDSNLLERKVFEITNNKLFYKGKCILEYNSSDNLLANSFEMDGNQMIINDRFEKRVESGIEFYLYKSKVICFIHNDTPVAIGYGNEHKNYSEQLVIIYKSLIENSDWNFFEQGAKYLIEHDSKFIKPYLERFSLGEFNDAELKKLDHLSINKSYIQRISKELNNTKK